MYDDLTTTEIIDVLAEYHNWARIEGNLADGFARNLSPTDEHGWEPVADNQIADAVAWSRAQ